MSPLEILTEKLNAKGLDVTAAEAEAIAVRSAGSVGGYLDDAGGPRKRPGGAHRARARSRLHEMERSRGLRHQVPGRRVGRGIVLVEPPLHANAELREVHDFLLHRGDDLQIAASAGRDQVPRLALQPGLNDRQRLLRAHLLNQGTRLPAKADRRGPPVIARRPGCHVRRTLRSAAQ